MKGSHMTGSLGPVSRRMLRAGAVVLIALMPGATPAQSPPAVSVRDNETPPRIVLDGLHPPSPAVPVQKADAIEQDPALEPQGARGAPADTNTSTDVDGSTDVDASTDPLIDVRRRWREAVRAGTTDLGFRAFVLGALEPDGDGQPVSTRIKPSGTGIDPPGGGDERAQAQRTREVSAGWQNRAGPVVPGKAGRVVTVFGASIPTAFCAPLIVCTIELEPGEQLTDTPSWGDTVRWQVTAKVQGDDPQTTVFEIKPSDDAEMTNLIIATDRRLYNINLVNSAQGLAGKARVHTPILSFTYPDTAQKKARQRITARKAKKAEDERKAAAARAAAAKKREQTLQRSGVETVAGLRDAGSLDFAFRVTGSAPFRPVRVYSDGRHTYIDLKPSYSGPLPALLPGRSEENKVLNTRVAANGTRLVADRVIRDMWLQAGKHRVRITRRGRP